VLEWHQQKSPFIQFEIKIINTSRPAPGFLSFGFYLLPISPTLCRIFDAKHFIAAFLHHPHLNKNYATITTLIFSEMDTKKTSNTLLMEDIASYTVYENIVSPHSPIHLILERL